MITYAFVVANNKLGSVNNAYLIRLCKYFFWIHLFRPAYIFCFCWPLPEFWLRLFFPSSRNSNIVCGGLLYIAVVASTFNSHSKNEQINIIFFCLYVVADSIKWMWIRVGIHICCYRYLRTFSFAAISLIVAVEWIPSTKIVKSCGKFSFSFGHNQITGIRLKEVKYLVFRRKENTSQENLTRFREEFAIIIYLFIGNGFLLLFYMVLSAWPNVNRQKKNFKFPFELFQSA